jgi:hypothetical protein
MTVVTLNSFCMAMVSYTEGQKLQMLRRTSGSKDEVSNITATAAASAAITTTITTTTTTTTTTTQQYIIILQAETYAAQACVMGNTNRNYMNTN